MMSATGSSRSGIALLEVLVAVAVFFAGIAAVLRGYATAAGAAESAREARQADTLLREKLAEYDLLVWTGADLPTGEGGEFSSAPGYRWRMENAALPDAELGSRRRVTVTVWRSPGGRVRGVTTWYASSSP